MSSTTRTVTSSSELFDAVKALSYGAGGVIKVENTGESYSLSGYRLGPESGEIRIEPADPADPPTFTHVKLVDGKNITVSGMTFDSTDVSGHGWRDVEILGGSDIAFEDNSFSNASNGYFDGSDPDVVWGSPMGLARATTDFRFIGNDVSSHGYGLKLLDAVGSVVADNVFTKITADGLRMSGVQDTLVEGNTFSAFYGSSQNYAHTDMVQVWSAPYNTLNTENLTIRDNVFNSSGGPSSQTIFINNETFRDTGTLYRDITIDNNTIYNGHVHGIRVNQTTGVTVTNNTLLWNRDSAMQSSPGSEAQSWAPEIRLWDVHDTVVTGNITAAIRGVSADDNAIVNYNNAGDPGYVGLNFVNADNAGEIDLRDMALTADSAWNGRFGASVTQSDAQAGAVTAVMRNVQDFSHVAQFELDATKSFGANGLLDPATTSYTWTFSDGTVLTGPKVAHDFGEAGIHEVTLTLTTESGTTASVTRQVTIRPDTLVALDFNDGLHDTSSFDSRLETWGSQDGGPGITGEAFHLKGGNSLRIERENDQIHDHAAFTMDIAFKREPGGDAGALVEMHHFMHTKITDAGEVTFSLNTSEGWIGVRSEAGLVSEDTWHKLTVTFDPQAGGSGLTIYLDGTQVAQTDATGGASSSGRHDLVIGSSWGSSMQGWVDNFTLKRSVDDADTVQQDHAAMQQILNGAPAPAPIPDFVSPMEAADLLLLSFDDGAVVDTSGQEARLWVGNGGETDGVTGQGFVLTGTSKVMVPRDEAHLHHLDSFTIALSMARAAGDEAGVFLHKHKAMQGMITEDGAVWFDIETEAGWFRTKTDAGVVAEDIWQRLAIVYDDAGDGGAGLQIYVDGVLEAQNAEIEGALNSFGRHHLTLGNTWNDSLEARIDDFGIASRAKQAPEMLEDYIDMAQDVGRDFDAALADLSLSSGFDFL